MATKNIKAKANGDLESRVTMLERRTAALEQLSKFCNVELLTVVNNYNWKELPELNKFLRKYNVKQNFELIRGEPLDKTLTLLFPGGSGGV